MLVAENELFAAELAAVSLLADRYTQLVNVYQAMGGGWVDIAGLDRAEAAGHGRSEGALADSSIRVRIVCSIRSEHVREERIGRHADQRIEADDQRAALAARGHRAEVDAEVLAGVGLHAVERIVHRKRQGDVRQREDVARIGQTERARPAPSSRPPRSRARRPRAVGPALVMIVVRNLRGGGGQQARQHGVGRWRAAAGRTWRCG